MSKSTTFIDPSSLSLPSPSTAASPSPGPSEPSRKRPRSETTPDERKEARAHRNRIAAQNSRDRRKAQYSYLERRVAELEEENRQLRAGALIPPPRTEQEEQEKEKERARERENEELRERIKSLEKGWDAVVKALAAQGLPTGIPTPPSTTSDSSSETASSHQPPMTFPVLVPPQPVYPLSPAPSSHSSIFTDDSSSSPSHEHEHKESTRHLARVATAGLSPPASLQRCNAPETTTEDDDAAMEDLLREILVAPSPGLSSAPLPVDPPSTSTSLQAPAQVEDWAGAAEMQRLLDMLPDVRQHEDCDEGAIEFPSALDLGWEELEGGMGCGGGDLLFQSSSSVGVF